MKHFLAIAFALLIGHQAFATHLIGGNLGYEFVGVFNGNYRYNIILTTYTNRDPNTSTSPPEDPIEDVGITNMIFKMIRKVVVIKISLPLFQ